MSLGMILVFSVGQNILVIGIRVVQNYFVFQGNKYK